MARDFDGSTMFGTSATTPVTGVPLTLACWGKSDDATLDQAALCVADSSSTAKFILRFGGSAAGDPIRAFTFISGSTSSNANSTSGYTAGVWHHAAAVFSAVDARAAYIDGGSKGTNTTSRTPTGIDAILLGCQYGSAANEQNLFDGQIAEAGIWDAALTDAEIALLAAGYAPPFVRPASLVAYWPLVGAFSPEIDWFGKYEFTLTASPTKADHPRIIYPTRRKLRFPPAAAANTQPRRSMHQFRLRRAG